MTTQPKVRTIEDLEKKYNFAKVLGLTKNVEKTSLSLLKIENELNSILTTLVINLSDVLDSQSEISLWFYSGTPTTLNEPYTTWTTPTDHIGDIYYDKSSGFVYQWNGVWEINSNPDLVEAMALTNAATDTTEDHERKVFFNDTPTIPYSSGDWWIKEDGSLFVCQISKNNGTYEVNDFINSSNYVENFAEKIGEELKVLKGTVTMISDNYAKFTDLATGGSTTIAGENISTGNIQSNNYVHNVSGMKIALSNGTIDSKNFKTDEYGNVYLGNGAKVIGGDGMMTNLQYESELTHLGQVSQSYEGVSIVRGRLELNVYIPENFIIDSAFINVELFKTKNVYMYDFSETITNYGKVNNIRLYKDSNTNEYVTNYAGSFSSEGTLTEISNAFANGGYTASTTEHSKFSSIIDLSNHLTAGTTKLVIQTGDPVKEISSRQDIVESTKQTQIAFATINIFGYMSYES